MNWPGPGSSEHDEPSHDHPPRDDGDEDRGAAPAPPPGDLAGSPHASEDPPRPSSEPNAADVRQPDDPPGYGDVRSESDGLEERWEGPADPAAVDSTWDRWEDDGGPAQEPPAPEAAGDLAPAAPDRVGAAPEVDAAPDPHVRPDRTPAGLEGPRSDRGATPQDAVSAPDGDDEAAGFTRPAFSPHTGSWDDVPERPGNVGGAAGADPAPPGDDRPGPELPAGERAGGEEPRHPAGHGEGDVRPESVEPHGLGLPPDLERSPDPGDQPEAPPSRGERQQAVTGPRRAGSLHGERAEPRTTSHAGALEDPLAGLEAPARQATVICVANQKGGVGKTTTTVSLGAALAMEGAQVLVVDLDPQGNATTGLGLRAQEGAPSTYRVIVEQMDVEDASEPTAVRGLHVLPSSLDLAGAEIELVPAFSRENRLKQALDAVRDLYDVILIDCPPSLGLLTINALVAADQVLVPIQCEYYALEGLGQLIRTVKLVADSLNRGLEVGGVVLTMFDGRTNLAQQVVDEVRGYFGDIAYQTIVPRTVRLSEAPSYGQPIAVFDASSRGARAYQRLAREVARRLGLELQTDDVSALDRLLGGPAPAPAPEEAAPLPTDLDPEDVAGVAQADREVSPGEHAEGTPEGDLPLEEPAGGPRIAAAPGEERADAPRGDGTFHGERPGDPARAGTFHGERPDGPEEPGMFHGERATPPSDGDGITAEQAAEHRGEAGAASDVHEAGPRGDDEGEDHDHWH